MKNIAEDGQHSEQESKNRKWKLWLKEFLGAVSIIVFCYYAYKYHVAGRDKVLFTTNVVVTKNECKLVCTGTLDEDSFAVYECKVFDMPGSKVYQITTHPKKTSK